MICSQRVSGDRQRLTVEFVGLVAALLVADGDSKVVELAGNLWMFVAEHRLLDLESPPKQNLGAGEVLAPELADSEIAEVDGDLVRVGLSAGFKDSQSALEGELSLVDSVLVAERGAKDGKVFGDEVVIGSEFAFTDTNSSSGSRCSLSGVAPGEGEPSEVVPQRRRADVV
jgi:hypothetical protein